MQLSKALVVLDLETTGTWIEKDKIVEIALLKYHPSGSRDVYHRRVNPGIPIPPAVSQLIGITNEDVRNEPVFSEIADEVLGFTAQCDFAGFNVERFDLPLLERELFQCGRRFEWQNRTIYDAQKIYHLNERRDLTAAYNYYCQKNLENAHNALADAEATYEILTQQVKKYGTRPDFYDPHRKFRWWNGELYPMFGKYAKRQSLQDIARKDPEYLQWVLAQDFSDEVKELVENALHGKFPEIPSAASEESL